MMGTCVVDGHLLTTILPPLLLLEFALGVLGNGLALWIFYFHLKPWKSSTVFLFNLALADFLLNVALPFRASYYLSGMDWKFEDMFCRISLFMLAMNRGGSVFFLMAVALDRYMRVVHPHHPINSMTVFKAVCGAVGLWVLTISLNAHLLTNSHHFKAGNSTKCESFTNKNKLHSAVFLLEFLVSLGIILFCTRRISGELRARRLDREAKIRRVQRCLGVVTIMFIVCFLPSNVARLLIWVRNTGNTSFNNKNDCDVQKALDTAFYITISLTYLNSMLDPVVYYFFSPSFKRIYKRILRLSLRQSSAGVNESQGSQCLSQVRLHIFGHQPFINSDTSQNRQKSCPREEEKSSADCLEPTVF